MHADQTVQPTQSPLPPRHPANGNGLSVTALVLGILAVVTLLVPFVGLILGILAIVFGIIALRKRQTKGLAIAGICAGTVAILLGLLGMLVIFGSYAKMQQKAKDTATQVEMHTLASHIDTHVRDNAKLPDETSIVNGTFMQDASGATEQVDLPVTTSGEPAKGTILYRPQSSCNQTPMSNELNFSLTTLLADGTVYCVDGQ